MTNMVEPSTMNCRQWRHARRPYVAVRVRSLRTSITAILHFALHFRRAHHRHRVRSLIHPGHDQKEFRRAGVLTKRDAQANTFEAAFDLTIARTDAPRNLGTAPLAASDEWGDQVATPDQLKIKLATGDVSSAPISDHQMSLVELARSMTAVAGDRIALLDHARPMTTEHDAAVYLRQAAERLRQLRRRRSNLLIKK